MLKLTSAKDVLEHTSLASKAWQRVSGSAELWLSHSDSCQLSPVCADPARFKLAYRQCFCQAEIVSGKMEVYNALSGNWWNRELQESTTFDAHSAGCWLADGRVFMCGGGSPATKKAAIVDVETGLVSSLQSMIRERAEHSSIYHNGQVYVFSGYANGVIRSCEKYSLSSGDWTPLPNSPDGIVNSPPCVHESTVYLCGIEFHTFLQFSLVTETFTDTRLKVRLEGSVKCCVAYEDCIMVIARGGVWKWKIGAEAADTKKASALIGGWCGCMLPVLLGSEVVLASESVVKRMDLETLQCRVETRVR